jgi:hypothetical protein
MNTRPRDPERSWPACFGDEKILPIFPTITNMTDLMIHTHYRIPKSLPTVPNLNTRPH